MSEYRGCIEHTVYDSGCDGCAEVQMVAAQSRDIADLTKQRDALRKALDMVMHELGVPGEGYPAPVANAYRIAAQALAGQPERSEARAHELSEAEVLQRIKDWSRRTPAAIEGTPDPQSSEGA